MYSTFLRAIKNFYWATECQVAAQTVTDPYTWNREKQSILLKYNSKRLSSTGTKRSETSQSKYQNHTIHKTLCFNLIHLFPFYKNFVTNERKCNYWHLVSIFLQTAQMVGCHTTNLKVIGSIHCLLRLLTFFEAKLSSVSCKELAWYLQRLN